MKPIKGKIIRLSILAGILVGNAVFLIWNMRRSFNLLDMGSFIDASWRVFCGQRLYQDFIYHSGPVYVYLNVLFARLFGFGQVALGAHLIAAHSIVIGLIFFLLWKRLPFYQTLLVTLLTATSFYWSTSFPWHDQTTHIWGIAAIFILLHPRFFLTAKRAFMAAFLCGILAGLAGLTKINIGLPYALVITALLLTYNDRWRILTGYIFGVACLLAGIWMVLGGLEYYWQQRWIVAGVLGQDRMPRFFKLKSWLVNDYWLPLFVVLINVNSLRFLSRLKRPLIGLAGLTMLGIISVNTGGILREANTSLWGILMALAFLTFAEAETIPGWPRRRRLYIISRFVLIAFAIVMLFVSTIDGVNLRVWSYVKWDHIGDYTLKSEPFKGWKCYHSLGKPMDDLTNFINTRVPQDESLLNLTDMYIIYTLTGRESYPHVPVAFMPGYYPAPGEQLHQVQEYIYQNPPMWVIVDLGMLFTEEDYLLGMRVFIKKFYTPVFRSGTFVLMRRTGLFHE